jgi:alpha-mannosidase
VKREDGGGAFGLATNALYGFNCAKGALLATVVRASAYAYSSAGLLNLEPSQPAVDAGELNFRFLMTAETGSLARLAEELEQPVVTQSVHPHPGSLPRSGSLFSIEQSNVHLLALKPAENGQGWIARVQEIAGKAVSVQGTWLGQEIDFGAIKPSSLNSFRLTCRDGRWTVAATSLQEIDFIRPVFAS